MDNKITCLNCNEEYDIKEKYCPNCNYPTKYNKDPNSINKGPSSLLFFLILIPVFAVLSFIYYINYDNNQSNGRILSENQLKIVAESITIRKTNNEESSELGKVKKDEIYTILEQEDDWYKIRTNTGITGWIYGGSNYVYIYDKVEENNTETKPVTQPDTAKNILKYFEEKQYKETYQGVYELKEEDTTYTYDLNKYEYKEKTTIENSTEELVFNYSNNTIHYTFETQEPIYSYISIDYDITKDTLTWEGKNLEEEYAKQIKDTKLVLVSETFNNILEEYNIKLKDLIKG